MTGLTRLDRRFLRKVIAVYAVLAIAAIAIPALVTRPRQVAVHHTEQDTVRQRMPPVTTGSEPR